MTIGEQRWVQDAFDKNWITTAGENVNELERIAAEYIGCKYAVGLSCGTAALHLSIKLAGEKLYGQAKPNEGTLRGHKVFCSDMTFDATINGVAYEDGEAVFIDTEKDSWNMDPQALEKAFEIYPDVKLIVVAHLYGTPGKIDEIHSLRMIILKDTTSVRSRMMAKYRSLDIRSLGMHQSGSSENEELQSLQFRRLFLI